MPAVSFFIFPYDLRPEEIYRHNLESKVQGVDWRGGERYSLHIPPVELAVITCGWEQDGEGKLRIRKGLIRWKENFPSQFHVPFSEAEKCELPSGSVI